MEQVETVASLVLLLIVIVSIWKIFGKAGQPGWKSIIPIYNIYVLFRIAGKPGWWLIFVFIPLVNIPFLLIVSIALAKSFNKDTGFGLGLFFLAAVFLALLAFGDAKYIGTGGGREDAEKI